MGKGITRLLAPRELTKLVKSPKPIEPKVQF